MIKNNLFLKILSIFVSTSILISGNALFSDKKAFADNTFYYLSEDFSNYATNSSPGKCTIDAPGNYVLENKEQNNKYFSLEGKGQLVSAKYSLNADVENLYISFDIEGSIGNESKLEISSSAGGFTAVKIAEDGSIMTYNGKIIGLAPENKFTNIAVSFNAAHSRYSIYINGKTTVSDYYVNSKFPSGKITGFTIYGLLNQSEEINLDNVYCYKSDKFINAKNHPKNPYSTKVEKVVTIDEVKEVNTSLIRHTTFDYESDQEMKTTLGSVFSMYPYGNYIGKVYDEREDNNYVHFSKSSVNDCFADTWVGNMKMISYQFDIRSANFSTILFTAIDSYNSARATIMTIGAGGRISSNGREIGYIQKRKWTNITICANNQTKVVNFYVDGKLAAENVPMTTKELKDIATFRIQLSGGEGSEFDFDDYVIYNGDQYVNQEGILTGILNEDLYIYKLKPLTVETVLGEYNAINTKSGFVSVNGILEKDAQFVEIKEDDLIIKNSLAMKLIGQEAPVNDADKEVSLKEVAEKNSKVVTYTDTGTVFVGDTEAELSSENLLAVNAYMIYDRPEREIFDGLFKNEHPRVLINKEKFEEIKSNFGVNKYVTKWGNDIINYSESVIKSQPYQFNTGYMTDEMRIISERVMGLSMAYHLTGDKKYAERCWLELETLCNFPDWNQDGHPLATASAVFSAAIGYDWLYDYLSDKQKQLLADKAYEFQLEPAYRTYHQALPIYSGWATVKTNWNAWTNGQVAIAACAFYEKNPEMYSDILENSLRCMEVMLSEFYPVGAWSEGSGYWQGTAGPIAMCMSTLEHSFGSNFGLEYTPALDTTCGYIIGTFGTNAANNFNDGAITTLTAWPMFYYGDKYDIDGYAQARLYDMDIRNIEGIAYDLCFYNPEIDSNQVDFPLDTYYEKIEIVGMRSSYTDPTATYVGFHSGNNLEAGYHAHVDSGTFVVDMLGERFVKDPGFQTYDKEGMLIIDRQTDESTIRRWSYYKLSPEGHNCLIFNPDETCGQNIVTDDKVETLVSKPKGAYSITSLSSAYEGFAKNVRRGFMLGDDRRSVTVRDEIELNDGNNEVWWFMHTDAITKLDIIDNNNVIMEKNGKKVKVTIATNANSVELKEMAPVQLVRKIPPEQDNDEVKTKKLGIKMNASGNLYIQVKMIPLDDPYANVPMQNIALDSWSIPDGDIAELPKANSMLVDGVKYEAFNSVNTSYKFTVPFGYKALPEVSLITEANVKSEVVYKAQDATEATMIRVYDIANPECYKTYYIGFEVDMSSIDDFRIQPVSIQASETPQVDYPAELTIDKDLSTRWSAEGDGQWLVLDLGKSEMIEHIGIAFHSGSVRSAKYKLYISNDKNEWELVFDGQSSGITDDIELTEQIGKNARYIKYEGFGNTDNKWNSVTEIAAYKMN